MGKHIRENKEAFAVKACNVMAYGDVAHAYSLISKVEHGYFAGA